LLRSALDNMLWQLVLLRGGTPTGHTQFPIYEKEPQLPRKPHRGKPSRGKRPWISISGVLPVDAAFIKKAQPFDPGWHHGEQQLIAWHPLAMLGKLNNVDKHNFIHVGYAAVAVPGAGADLTRIRPAFVGTPQVLRGIGVRALDFLAVPRWDRQEAVGVTGWTYECAPDDRTQICRVFGTGRSCPGPPGGCRFRTGGVQISHPIRN